MEVTCPYGNTFVCGLGSGDSRGSQDEVTPKMDCKGIARVELHVPSASDLDGVQRFYRAVFGVESAVDEDGVLVVPFGPNQVLAFKVGTIENDNYLDGTGPHISLYVDNLTKTWVSTVAIKRSLVYVNPRFKRQAKSLDEALDQCMFRVLNIVDPLSPERTIMRLEHEIRSATKVDGTKYKSFVLKGE